MLDSATAHGLDFLVPAQDTGVGRCLKAHGEFAPLELELILELCDGDFVDVGANIGAICLPFAAARPQRRVVAIEAHRKLAQILGANALNNRLYNVEVMNRIAGEQSGLIAAPMAPIDEPGNLGAVSLYDKKGVVEQTQMATLDALAPPGTRFVKIDVEGFEPRVLRGAERLLNEVRPFWLVEVSSHRPNAAAAVRERLTAAGYRLHWFFSPFTTSALAASAETPPLGDAAYFASDGDPPWPMAPVGDAWPHSLSDFPYLARYGVR